VGDDHLVARVRAGDHDAFETIYDRYSRGLLAFCRHMLGSRDEAEDALQQSFASAYRALRGGTGVIDLRPWLYAIARNRCLSALRAQRDDLSVDALDLTGRPFEGLPSEIALRAELRELVEDLQRLPDDQRAALVLFELGDQSHEQIAAVLDVRREKVKALVFQAREALLRARRAREASCADIRERLASLPGDVPRRGMLRCHIDRCPGCAAFELEVRRQRTAFAAILPVAPTVGLKGSVLALLGGGGAAAGGAGAGAAAVAGSVAAGGTTVGLASLGAKGIVTKALAVVALAGGTTEAKKVDTERAPTHKAAHVRHYVAPPSTKAPVVNARAAASYATPTLRHRHHAKVTRGGESLKTAPAPERPATRPAQQPAPVAPQQSPAPAAEPSATAAPARASAPATPPTDSTTSTPSTPTRTDPPQQTTTAPAPQTTTQTTTAAPPTTTPDTAGAPGTTTASDTQSATTAPPTQDAPTTSDPGAGSTAAATSTATPTTP
jgi:RNA polymerase sigma factor (sigma-70 family)